MIPALKTVNSEYDNLDTDLIQLNISNVQQISNKTPLTITEYETNKPKNLIVDGISFEFNIENQLDDYESLRYRFHEYLIQNQKITHFSSFKSHTFLRYFTNVLLERLSVEAEFEFLRRIQNKFNGIFDKRNIHYSSEEKIKMKIGII
jgi:hypothetical protein